MMLLLRLLTTLSFSLSAAFSLTTGGKQKQQQLVNRRDAIAYSAGMSAAGAGLVLPGNVALAKESSSSSSLSPVTTLPGGISFPLASFGLQIYDDETAYKLTLLALQVGYRNFFASVLAGNQRGFARAVRDSGIPRDELFICGSVVSNKVSGYQEAYKLTTKGWKQNMAAFGAGNIDYLDQIMLDYPGPNQESILGQWRAFQEMQQDEKLTRTLSVSNFSPPQLDYILQDPSTTTPTSKPLVNQLPFSVAYHGRGSAYNTIIEPNTKQRGVLVQAWAPLGGSLGGRFDTKIKQKCAEIGKPHGKSFAQVALRWIVQNGASFTTQSKKKEHFAEDLDIFDFELSPDEMTTLDGLA